MRRFSLGATMHNDAHPFYTIRVCMVTRQVGNEEHGYSKRIQVATRDFFSMATRARELYRARWRQCKSSLDSPALKHLTQI